MPFVVGDSDDGRFEDSRVRHDGDLEVHRTDPLAPRFDDVLAAVAHNHEPFCIERADVARAQPTVTKLVGIVLAKVRAGDPRAANLKLTD